ncbi:hypothetical protein CATMIT_01801, partial [Catenibacterium mitsuokai DSM 15897]
AVAGLAGHAVVDHQRQQVARLDLEHVQAVDPVVVGAALAQVDLLERVDVVAAGDDVALRVFQAHLQLRCAGAVDAAADVVRRLQVQAEAVLAAEQAEQGAHALELEVPIFLERSSCGSRSWRCGSRRRGPFSCVVQ